MIELPTVESAIFRLLRDDSGISELILDRVYFGLRPEKDPDPAINFFRYAGTTYQTLSGRSCVAKGYFQISCWGINSTQAARLRLLVKRALTAGIKIRPIQSIFIGNENEMFDNELREYQAIIEAEIIYEEV